MEKITQQIVGLIRSYVDKVHNGVQKSAAAALGIKEMTLSNWLKGKRTPNLEALHPVFESMRLKIVLPSEDYSIFEYDFIPKVAAKAGAGASLETSDEAEALFAFRKDWMGANNIHAGKAVLMDVVGDSMEPLLRDGDCILIDKNETDILDGRIYVVTLGDELRVKRIYRGLSGIILRSENASYPDVHVEGPDLETLKIWGRVRWCGKTL